MEQTVVKPERKGITGTGLKNVAIMAMFIDHFAAILLEDYLEMVIPHLSGDELWKWFDVHPDVAIKFLIMLVMRLIGRFGFPIFAFLLVEGIQHTRSVFHYALRLGAFALISELPFNLGFASKLFYPKYQNVFFTLVLGLLCMATIEFLKGKVKDSKKWNVLAWPAAFLCGAFVAFMFFWEFDLVRDFIELDKQTLFPVAGICGIVSFVAYAIIGRRLSEEKKNAFTFTILPIILFCALGDILRTDYGAGGVLTIAIMYLFRKNKMWAFTAGCIVLTLLSEPEATAFFMLIPISKYNGKRGMKVNKFLFYAFYPVHIGLIYLLTLVLGYTTFALH